MVEKQAGVSYQLFSLTIIDYQQPSNLIEQFQKVFK